MSELPMMTPVVLACSCGAYLAVMRTKDGWMLNHPGTGKGKGIAAPTLEECIVEFDRNGIDHAGPRRGGSAAEVTPATDPHTCRPDLGCGVPAKEHEE